MEGDIKFYKVVAKCGHVGRKKYIPIAFALKAKSGKEAASRCRIIPRVKHDSKTAILACDCINKEQYDELLSLNNDDPYLKCHNSSQQRQIKEFETRLVIESIDKNFKDKSNSKKYNYFQKRNKEKLKQAREDYYEEYIY